MGWFWGDSDDKKPQSDPAADPLRDLDPGLRDFLKKESPIRYTPTTPPAAQSPEQAPQPPQSTPASPPQPGAGEAAVPAPSLFKDGRYAHLWTTYEPQSAVEAASKSDAEKIADVLEGYKYRKAEIGRAALENCALEQWEVNECFTNGSVASRLTLCRTENRSLERCVEMQQKFLKALGYLSTFDRLPEVDERIQMHADTLFHRMLDQEKAAQEAEKEGREAPKFAPLLRQAPSAPAAASSTQPASASANDAPAALDPISRLPSAIQEQIKLKLDGLSGIERELQETALVAEVSAGQEVKANLKDIYKDQEGERQKRREEGRETMMDRFSTTFGGSAK